MNTLVLVLSYIVLLLIVAVGYLLWNDRKLNRVADSTPNDLSELWKRIHEIKKVIDGMPHHAVPWSAFENFQEAINGQVDDLQDTVDDLVDEYKKGWPHQKQTMLLHTNPEDSHAAE